ncbi:MAG: hypothetical protein ACE37N_02165 [Pseudohongiellaceae bacterium]
MPGLPSASAGSQSSSQGQQSSNPAGSQGSASARNGSTPADSGGSSANQGQTAASGSAAMPDGGGTPGQSAGSQSRFPGQEQAGAGGRDSATGDLNNGQSGAGGGGSSILRPSGGDYSLDTLPDGVLSGNGGASGDQAGAGTTGQSQGAGQRQSSTGSQPGAAAAGGSPSGTGSMTADERTAALDEALRRGYETFDGFILGERERAQRESNAAGSVEIAGQDGGGGSGGSAANQPQILNEGGNPMPSGVIAATSSLRAPVPRPARPFHHRKTFPVVGMTMSSRGRSGKLP